MSSSEARSPLRCRCGYEVVSRHDRCPECGTTGPHLVAYTRLSSRILIPLIGNLAVIAIVGLVTYRAYPSISADAQGGIQLMFVAIVLGSNGCLVLISLIVYASHLRCRSRSTSTAAKVFIAISIAFGLGSLALIYIGWAF